jgi:hypothetical protein
MKDVGFSYLKVNNIYLDSRRMVKRHYELLLRLLELPDETKGISSIDLKEFRSATCRWIRH